MNSSDENLIYTDNIDISTSTLTTEFEISTTKTPISTTTTTNIITLTESSTITIHDADYYFDDHSLYDDPANETMSHNDVNKTLLYVDYFLYGLNHSYLVNSTGHDEYMYGSFSIPNGFPILNSSFSYFYINSNGYISFMGSGKFDMNISPFESDIDLRGNGFISHGPITQEDLLYSIGIDVSKICRLNFVPTWAYIITV